MRERGEISGACLALLGAVAAQAQAPPAPPAQPPGTQQMVELLRNVVRDADPLENPFLNTRRVAMMRQAAAANPEKWKHPNLRFQMAAELLLAGETEASLR